MFNCAGGGEHGGGLGGLPVEAGGGRRAGEGGLGHVAAPGGRQTPITYPCSLKTWSHAFRAACPFVLEKKKATFRRCARRRQFRLRSSALQSTVSTGWYSMYMQPPQPNWTQLPYHSPSLSFVPIIFSFPRFLALVPLKLSQLQLLGSACLMVAWKVEIILKSHDMCHLWTDN